MVPLVMGTIWMLGAMRLCGLAFNFANLVAVPLIIGVGIDNGVHVIHRVRLEGAAGMSVVLQHTGRAILSTYFDPSLKTPVEVEAKLGLPVLVSVPKVPRRQAILR